MHAAFAIFLSLMLPFIVFCALQGGFMLGQATPTPPGDDPRINFKFARILIPMSVGLALCAFIMVVLDACL